MKNTTLLFVLLLGGCQHLVDIDYSTAPPNDWPALEEKVSRVDITDIPKFCRGLGADATRVSSCAVTSFRYGVCYIYLATDDHEALKHERGHCKGYGHVGDARAPAKAWESYKARFGEGKK